jgi:hypothetical protein
MSNIENSSDSDNNSRYNTHKKKRLVEKITKLKPAYQLQILKIMKPEIKDDYTINNNGTYLFFHAFSDEMYDKIAMFIRKVEDNKNKRIIKSIVSDFSDTVFNSDVGKDTSSDIIDAIEVDTEKDLNNKERLIMRRKKYHEYLDKNQN